MNPAKHESFDEFVSTNNTVPKNYCCPVCQAKIDLEHYAFVLEVMKDPKKQEAWRKKEYTFKMWQEEHK